MSGTVAVAFTASGIAVLAGTEIVRSIIHRRRVRATGIGGTQDIAMWGTLLSAALLIGAVISGAIWIWSR